jgi:UDP-N-acetylmuramoylalanine--D-glutamate ligase
VRDWTGHLVVLGLGASGRAAAEWGLSRAHEGVRVTVLDSGAGDALAGCAASLRDRGAEVRLGVDHVEGADIVVASPGIRPTAPLMVSARALGVPVISEIELAYRISRAPWVAITGTNGKTTTTALVTHLLREAGFVAEPAGNIGPAAVRVAMEVGEAGMIVAEVSSFQLSLTDTFHPRVAALLNITPDHIDYHGSLEAYAAEKAKVFARQVVGDTAVIDVDDQGSRALADPVGARGVTLRRVSRTTTPADGAYLRGTTLVLEERGVEYPLVDISDLRIMGEHNVSNALAAAACARAAGAGIEAIRSGLLSFAPIEHRLEPVRTVDGAEYFNDSKATNPDAVLKALTAFGDRPLVLLLGGRNKGVDMLPLAAAVKARTGSVVVFGEAAAELAGAFESVALPVMSAPVLEDAVRAARGLAVPGGVVLLSPGCTSFDEFSGYEERGRRFKEIVGRMGEST